MPASRGRGRRDPDSEEVVEIGEMPVRIRSVYCCGLYEWYGLFPDNTRCCEYPEHGSFDEALECAKKRVAKGFIFKLPSESTLD